MYRQLNVGQWLCCIFATIIIVSEVQASDLSELLWGGRGSRTTVSDPYAPPPLTTQIPVVPVTDTAATATMQSQLMLGTPGAMTLPSGGVYAPNGLATTGVSSASYVWQSPATTASNIIPAVQLTPTQPVIEYEWTYSTIKDVKNEPITVYDPRLGGYVTTMQERQTESVLPWLHRKQVVRYPVPTADTAITGAVINNPVTPVASDTSERRIVNRLFPVSTVPSPPAQAAPVQTFSMPTTPVTTYATPTYAAETPVNPPIGSPIQPASTTVMRVGDLPVVPAVTIPQIGSTRPTAETVVSAPATTIVTTQNQPAPISSSLADAQPSLPPVVSPSAQQVLYPNVPAANTRTNSPLGTPTLAPTKSDAGSEQPPVSQETVTLQRPRIEDSILSSEKLRTVELPPGSMLPPPAQASTIPSLEAASSAASTEYPLLTNETPSTTPPATQPGTRLPSATGTPSGRNVSPTRLAPLYN